MFKRIRKAGSVLFYAVIFILMAAGAIGAVGVHQGWWAVVKPYIVMSGSMEPRIPTGAVVLVQANPNGYQIGDVITFGLPGNEAVVTHRIADMAGGNGKIEYVTKGDANKTVDSKSVAPEMVVGKVITTIPYLGYGVQYAKEPYGFILMVIVPATIIVYEELKNLGKELGQAGKKLFKRKKKKEEVDAAEESPVPVINTPVVAVPVKLPNAPTMPMKYGMTPAVNSVEVKPDEPVIDKKVVKKTVDRGTWRWLTLVPTMGVMLIFAGITGAYFMDSEESLGNVLGAAADFGETNVGGRRSYTQNLVINEVMPLGDCELSGTPVKWLEVYNGSEESVEILGLKLTNGTESVSLTAPEEVILGPQEMVLVTHRSEVWNECYPEMSGKKVYWDGELSWEDKVLKLTEADGAVIDRIEWSVYPRLSAGRSVERAPTGWDSVKGDEFVKEDLVVMRDPTPGI